MFDVLSGQYKNLASKGRYGDTMLAHINPQEAALLKARGGAGTINPQTGLPEFYGAYNTMYGLPFPESEPLPVLAQVFDPNAFKNIAGKLQTITVPQEGFGLGIRPAYDKISPEFDQYANRTFGGMGTSKLEGYTLPTDQVFQGKPLEAKYDPKGNFIHLQLAGGDVLIPDPNQPNIAASPKFNKSGGIIDYGVFDLNQQDDGGFGSFIGGLVEDFGPMILAGLGANYLAGSGLLGAGAAGGAGAALSPYAAQAAGAYGGSSAAAAAAAGGSLTGIQAASAAQNALTQAAQSGTGLTFGQGVTPTTPTTPDIPQTPTTPDIPQTPPTTPTTPTTPNIPPTTPTTPTTPNIPPTTPTIPTTPNIPPTTPITPTVPATVAGNADKAALFGAEGYGAPATAAELANATSIFSKLGDAGSSLLDFVKANPSISGSLLGAVTSAIGGANAPKTQTTTSSIDPQIKAEYLTNLQSAKDAAAGLQTRKFEDFTPDYELASQQVKNLGLGGKGQQTTDKAVELALKEAGFAPQQIKAATAGKTSLADAIGYTAQQIAAAQANRANVANVASDVGAQYMSAYQNPFEEQVVQGALGDIERSRLMQEQANMAQATRAGAFGGSRQGVVSGMTNEAALRQAASTAAQLRSAGFTQAAQFGQTDAARALQAQLANQGIDVTLEQANAQLSQQGLLSNQAAFNQAAQFGASATNQANLANAAARNQRAQFDAQMKQQAKLANQAAYAQGAVIRQGAIGQAGQLGAQQQNLGLSGANAVMEDQIRKQALAQARLDAARNLKQERLGITGGALSLQPARTGETTTQPLYNNTAGNLLSGGLTGAYIGSLLGR